MFIRSTIRSENLELSINQWNPSGPATVILVHGYPDSSEVWDHVAEKLAEHFHVVTYDVRGCGESDAPKHFWQYSLLHLCNDFHQIINYVSPYRPVHLVGHDWGSIQCWEFVTNEKLSKQIASYSSFSGPCLDHVGYWFRERLSKLAKQDLQQAASQLLHSWYIGLFHVPVVAPLMWRLGLAQAWPNILARTDAVSINANPCQLRNGVNGINLYRANMLARLLFPKQRRTNVPVQLVVAQKDPFITEQVLSNVEHWAPNLTRTKLAASHWLPLSEPQQTAKLIQDHIKKVESTQNKPQYA